MISNFGKLYIRMRTRSLRVFKKIRSRVHERATKVIRELLCQCCIGLLPVGTFDFD